MSAVPRSATSRRRGWYSGLGAVAIAVEEEPPMSTADLTALRNRSPIVPTLVGAIAVALLVISFGLLGSLWLLGTAGAEAYPVASDSMVPVFARGDLVVTQPASRLRVGDIVTFRKYGHLITHRIVASGRVPGTFETRGDANPGNDPWTISPADITGRVQSVVHRAGMPLLIGESTSGRIVGANLLLAALISAGWAVPRAVRNNAVAPAQKTPTAAPR